VDVRPTKETGLPGRKGDALTSESTTERPVGEERLMEEILERRNLIRALKRVEQNKGGAGVDGMKVEELRPYLAKHWPEISEELLSGSGEASRDSQEEWRQAEARNSHVP
jgi:retron-type reverse transcriptase